MKVTSHALLACALMGVTAMAAAQQPPLSAQPIKGPILPADLPPGRVSEGLPRDVYVTGDPMLLTRENMHVGERITFVACPYMRDSEPTPLWFADYNGETYFLRAQQNLSARVRHPQLKHKILVEGIISPEPRLGNAIVLNPLRLSVLPEVDIACDKLLPADGTKIKNPKRPPGPGVDGVARETGAERGRQNAARLWAKDYTPDPVDKREKREFIVQWDFDQGVGAHGNYQQVVQAVKYARDVNASKVEIIGYRASVLLSNGEVLVEKPGVEKERVETVKTIFDDYPFPPGVIQLRWDSNPRPADGIADFEKRTVSIIVTPGPEQKVAKQ
jgi:hypothetical protein